MKFATIKEKLDFFVKNKAEIISIKKSAVKHTDPIMVLEDGTNAVTKAFSTSNEDDLANGIIKRTIVGNTYNWCDSQMDVLLDNCFATSLKDRQDKIWHLHDHINQIGAKVGKPVSIYEKSVAWTDLGIQRAGNTMCLMMDSNIMKSYNSLIYQQYLDKEIDQHSVGMQYVNLQLAVNDPEYKDEYAVWNKYINLVANKKICEDEGMFWAVKEGKLMEISAVLTGANSLTPTLDNKKMSELLKTQKDEKKAETDFYTNLVTDLKSNPLKL
jgi:hypothetical protein